MTDPSTNDPAPDQAPAEDTPPAEDSSEDKDKGQVVTFYSYKGGVGRSMTLSNIAVILARDFGLHVVMVDWDLEAPGLHRYFDIPDAESGRGVIDYFTNYKQLLSRPPEEVEISPHDLDIRNYARVIEEYDRGGLISFLSAGDQSDATAYVDRVSGFDWDDFYRNWNGSQLIEAVRAQLQELGDVILIDSRTGITDTGGICTLHLPDVVVLVFAFNSQNLDGIARIAEQISGKSKILEVTNRHPEALFLPSRKDVSEIAQLREWETRAIELFAPYILASPRIVERFGDDALEYIRATSVPYVPYFAFGEELAARTDKGYEMTAALEILADMLSPTPPLMVPRKATSSQPYGATTPVREPSNITLASKGLSRPRREASTPGRRLSHAGPPSPVDPGAATSDAAGDESPVVESSPGSRTPTSQRPVVFARPLHALGFLVVLAILALLVIKISGIGDRIQASGDTGRTTAIESESTTDSESLGSDNPTDEVDADHLDPAKLRANVRFEFLTVYPRDRPPPRAFDGYLPCDIALGAAADGPGWSSDWKLRDIVLELSTANSEPQKIAENASVQNVTYSQFEVASGYELPALADLGGLVVQARLAGTGTDPGWLTGAWEVAEAQKLGRGHVREEFRSFYAVDEDEDDVPVDVTPVVATMILEYDGRPMASLAGWVARDVETRKLIVTFIPAKIGPSEEAESAYAPTAESLGPYIDDRDSRTAWLEGIMGQGEYYTTRGDKRFYHLSVAIPTDAMAEIASVRYELPDGKVLSAKSAGSRGLWPVTTSTVGCEGTVSIAIERTTGETLPLSFDWCQDAVKVSPPNSNSYQPTPDASTCNKSLVAKNKSVAADVCAKAYASATSEADRRRLLELLIAATRDYGDDREHCRWLEQAAEMDMHDAESMLNAADGRCRDTRQQTQDQGSLPRKPR